MKKNLNLTGSEKQIKWAEDIINQIKDWELTDGQRKSRDLLDTLFITYYANFSKLYSYLRRVAKQETQEVYSKVYNGLINQIIEAKKNYIFNNTTKASDYIEMSKRGMYQSIVELKVDEKVTIDPKQIIEDLVQQAKNTEPTQLEEKDNVTIISDLLRANRAVKDVQQSDEKVEKIIEEVSKTGYVLNKEYTKEETEDKIIYNFEQSKKIIQIKVDKNNNRYSFNIKEK